MEKLTKENTVLVTTGLTKVQMGIVYDTMVENGDNWDEYPKEEFVEEWGVGLYEPHNTIAYNPNDPDGEFYNSEKYFNAYVEVEPIKRTRVTFKQWLELHTK